MVLFDLSKKTLEIQDQNLMRQFVKLRGALNSLKSQPVIGRKVSLPVDVMNPNAGVRRTLEMEESLFDGNRRRTQSAFAGILPEYPYDLD